MSENTNNEICSPVEILLRQLETLLSCVKQAAFYEKNGLKAISGEPFQKERFTEATLTLPAEHLQKVYDSIEPAIQNATQVSLPLTKEVSEILKKLSETGVELSLELIETSDKTTKLSVKGVVAKYIDEHRQELNALAVIVCKLKESLFSKITPPQLSEGDLGELIKKISQLRNHFENAEREFPLLTYAVMKWPYLRQEPEILKELVIKRNFRVIGFLEDSIALVQNDSESEPITPAEIKRWIFRPDGQLWNWDVALNRLQEFGNKAEEIREKIEPIVYPMNNISEKWQRWLVFLYNKANPVSHTDFKTLYCNSTSHIYPEITRDLPCYFLLDDVFLKSKLACNDLLEMLSTNSDKMGGTKKATTLGQRKRPTKMSMDNRNRIVLMAATEIQQAYDRLPTVQEIMEKTKLTASQIYATAPYKDGKIAKNSAKVPTTIASGSVTTSERFRGTSIEHSRVNRQSKSDRDELDVLIDQQEKDNSSDFVS